MDRCECLDGDGAGGDGCESVARETPPGVYPLVRIFVAVEFRGVPRCFHRVFFLATVCVSTQLLVLNDWRHRAAYEIRVSPSSHLLV